MKHLLLSVILGSSVFLASCSFREDLEYCPPLSAPIEGARAFVATDELKQTVDVSNEDEYRGPTIKEGRTILYPDSE